MSEFDETIHAPLRLRACAMLAAADAVEFAAVRDMLGVADSVASKHLKVLADAGYVELDRPQGQKGRARTWVSMTPAGRTAFEGHLAALRAMVEAAGAAAQD